MTRPDMQGPTAYPSGWRPKGAPPPDEPVNLEALALAIDAYLAALSDAEFAALAARVRGNGQQQQYGQQQPQYGQQQTPHGQQY
jgi:hypothetical protein